MKTKIILTARDLKILEFLAKFGVASDYHLMLLINQTDATKYTYRNVMYRLANANFIQKHRLIEGEHTYFTLGTNGAKLINTSRLTKLNLNTLRHDILVLDIYFDIKAKNPEIFIMSERELKIASGYKVGDIKKVPDLFINNTIAIEVEISQKSHDRLIEIISNYISTTNIKEVHYFVKSRTLGTKILNLAGGHKKFKIFLLDKQSQTISYYEITHEILENKVIPLKINNRWSFDLDKYLQS